VVGDGLHHAALPGEGLLNERQAAAFLGVSPRTLWGLANRGEVPFIRISRTVKRYAMDDLKAYCDRNRVNGGVADKQHIQPARGQLNG
jgi:hypothetical protein